MTTSTAPGGTAPGPDDAQHPPAFRVWHCGTCYFELVGHGDGGKLACETCGRVYRPDADGHSAPCIEDGDGRRLDTP